MYRYYSILRPVGLGTLPSFSNKSVERDCKVVNFNARKFVPGIGREAWGYVEYPIDIRDLCDVSGKRINLSDYDLVMEGSALYREIRPGDIIARHDSKVMVLDILSQNYSASQFEIDVEFKDQNGKYRRWRNCLDGGYVNYLESNNVYSELSDKSKKLLKDCWVELIRNYVGTDGSPVCFARAKKDLTVYHLYDGARYRGFVDLESADLNKDSDLLFYSMLVSAFGDSEFDVLLFPCSLSGGEFILKKRGIGIRTYLKAKFGTQFK